MNRVYLTASLIFLTCQTAHSETLEFSRAAGAWRKSGVVTVQAWPKTSPATGCSWSRISAPGSAILSWPGGNRLDVTKYCVLGEYIGLPMSLTVDIGIYGTRTYTNGIQTPFPVTINSRDWGEKACISYDSRFPETNAQKYEFLYRDPGYSCRIPVSLMSGWAGGGEVRLDVSAIAAEIKSGPSGVGLFSPVYVTVPSSTYTSYVNTNTGIDLPSGQLVKCPATLVGRQSACPPVSMTTTGGKAGLRLSLVSARPGETVTVNGQEMVPRYPLVLAPKTTGGGLPGDVQRRYEFAATLRSDKVGKMTSSLKLDMIYQ